MKNRAILTDMIFIALQSLYSQKNVKSLPVVSYNVENLPPAIISGPDYFGGPGDHLPFHVDLTP